MLPFDGEHPQALSIPSKVCRLCNERKALEDFPNRPDTFDKLDTRCKICRRKMYHEQKTILRTAPPKPADGRCECCGRKPKKWHMDHDHKTKKFRGWLCDACNMSIGHLGDCVDGLMNAVQYLKRAEKSEMIIPR